MGNTIKLNFCNFFTYFAFNTKDNRLSDKDKKIAKAATICFAFTVLGHAFCRLFLYKKISVKSSSVSTKKTDDVSGKHLQGSKQKKTTTKPDKLNSKPSQGSKKTKAKSVSSESESSSSSTNGGSSLKPRPTCQFVLKDYSKNPKVKEGPKEFIADIKLPSGHPCLQKVDFSKDLSGEHAYSKAFSKEKIIDWPFPGGKADSCKKDPKLDALIDERLQQWDDAIQLKERIMALKDRSHLENLTLGDLEDDFDNSVLKVALCSDEEFQNLMLEGTFTDRQIEMIRLRWPNIAKDPYPDVHPTKLHLLTFQQFKGLDADFITANWEAWPDTAIQLISKEQIKKLDFSGLDTENPKHKENFDLLFPIDNPDQFHLLSLAQIQSCWNLISDEQIVLIPITILKQINFSNFPLTREKFEILFPVFKYGDVVMERRISSVQHLSNKQILQCWEFFDGPRMGYLTDEQVQGLPEDRFIMDIPEDCAKFKGIFRSDANHRDEGQRRMALIEYKKLMSYWPVIDNETIVLLSKEQLAEVDFDDYPISKECFDTLFPDFFYCDNSETERRLSRIQELSEEQLTHCWEHLEPYHMGYLSEEQLGEFDFSKLLCSERNIQLFNSIFAQSSPKLAADRMAAYPVKMLKKCWHLVDEKTPQLLSPTQLPKIGTDVFWTKEQFKRLFPLQHLIQTAYRFSRVQELSIDQVQFFITAGFFDRERMKYLSLDHIKNLDFRIFSADNFELFKGLFSKEYNDPEIKMHQLSNQQLRECWPLINGKLVKLLSIKQVQALDETFDVSKEQFEGLFPKCESYKVRFSRIKELSAPQIERLLPLFDEERILYLSVEQWKDLKPKAFEDLGDHGKKLFEAYTRHS